jgi:hypothetical protein
VALAILMELNIRLTVLVVETARLERRGVNDSTIDIIYTHRDSLGEIRYRHDFTTLLMSSLDFQSGFFIHIHLNHSSSWPSADVEISLCGILTLLICGLFNL